MSIIMDGSDPLVFKGIFKNGIRELTWPKTMMLKTAHIDSDVFELVDNKTQAEPEWTGEGIPPSGTACEMRRADYVNVGWQKIEFLFAGSKKAFFRDEQGHEWSSPLSDLKFRSIRTPEQIAAEKRLHKIRNACTDISKTFDRLGLKNDIPGGGVARAVIEAMIDAGYAKQVEK